jgi:transcriptional regulator NrdR family protein
MFKVIKRNGKAVPFDERKLRRSIEKAVLDAGHKLDDKKSLVGRILNEVIDKFGNNGPVETKDLREAILDELDRAEPSISKSWRSFDKKYKSTKPVG